MDHYDCIVVGVGAIGSAALAQLARRGVRALGVERFEPGHDRGSSHGRTRVIRLAYTEHPDYVPLLHRAWASWRQLDALCRESLLVECGILEAGPAAGELVQGVLRSARDHDLEVEELGPAELAQRIPGLRLESGMRALFEPVAGYLQVEDCVRSLVKCARADGAELVTDAVVEGWSEEGGQLVVRSTRGSWRTSSLILTQGAWAAEALAGVTPELEVLRKVQLWFANEDPRYRPQAGFVPFVIETPEGRIFYGFPELHEASLKAAEHSGGTSVSDPLELERGLLDSDKEPVLDFLRSYMPGVKRECRSHAVCMYTQTSDGHFVLDRHSQHPRVAYAAGLSGHGFKFAPVLGEALADLALEGGSALPIEFLSAARFETGG